MITGVFQIIELKLLRMNGERLKEALWPTGQENFKKRSLKLQMKIAQNHFM